MMGSATRWMKRSALQKYRVHVLAGIAVVLFLPSIVSAMKLKFDDKPDPSTSRAPSTSSEPITEFDRQIALSRALLDARRAKESLVPLAQAARIDPNAFALHNNLCVAFGILERKHDAVTACRRAVELDPNDRLARNNLAWVSGLRDDPRQ